MAEGIELTLAKRWQGKMFRRGIRDKSGKILKMLEFARDETVSLTKEAEFRAIRDAVGSALDVVGPNGRADQALTDEAVLAICHDMKEAAEKSGRAAFFTPAQLAVMERAEEVAANSTATRAKIEAKKQAPETEAAKKAAAERAAADKVAAEIAAAKKVEADRLEALKAATEKK